MRKTSYFVYLYEIYSMNRLKIWFYNLLETSTTYLPTYLPYFLPTYLPTYQPTYVTSYLPYFLPTYLL